MEHATPNIYDYFDYRKYLHEAYLARKRESTTFSIRFMSGKLGIDAGYLARVMQGVKHVTPEGLGKVSELLKLGRRETVYLETLYLFNRAKTERESRGYFERLLGFTELGARAVEASAYEFYRQWYYTAVREAIGLAPFRGDYAQLARMPQPPITPAQARKAVSLLERLQFIRRGDDGVYEVVSRFVTTGEEWKSLAVREFQRQTLSLASRALADTPKDERDISTVTLSLSSDAFEHLKEKVSALRREALELAHAEPAATRTYHLNLSLFPITRRVDGGGTDAR